jgi:serine/threonine protein kinase/tetratricopeptide (TPR) repeat protein
MGVVYRAEHMHSRALAAVKTVSVPHGHAVASIRREIQALAQVDHPGVVRIVDEGLIGGVPWYAMELLEGVTLRQLSSRSKDAQESFTRTLMSEPGGSAEFGSTGPRWRWWAHALEPVLGEDEQPTVGPAGFALNPTIPAPTRVQALSVADSVNIIRRLCAPLAYLHGEGIVHRDLKPENILVSRAGDPVLVDFGLVTQYWRRESREVLEVDSATAGTIAYMSPEQLRGELVDARADLYALGCILYELLTGRHPFQGRTLLEVAQGHLETVPDPPSELADGIPRELDTLVLRLLAKQPRERIGHADDVAAVLATIFQVGADEPVGPKPRAYIYRPGFIGRADTLRSLERLLLATTRGHGGIALVLGESGVGKTRLAMEVAREAERRSMFVLTGDCVPSVAVEQGQGSAAFGPFRAMLERIADRCHEKGQRETDRLFGQRGSLLAPYAPGLGRQLNIAHDRPADLSRDDVRSKVFDAFAGLFRAVAAQRGALLILDDVQWADEHTLAFIQDVLERRRFTDQRVMIVATCRSDELSVPLQALAAAPEVHKILLQRFDETAVADMVADMLALDEAPPSLVRYLVRQSEGIPFFVAEYVRAAVTEGLLARDEHGRWIVADRQDSDPDPFESLEIPGSLREVVGRRIDSLSPGARQLAEVASVLGREVDGVLLAGVSAMSGAELMGWINQVLARQVMEEHGPERFRFAHDIVREVTYERIPEDRRAELHRTAALAIDAQRVRGDGQLAVLAYHWERAGQTQKARDCYLSAARVCLGRYERGEAERLYRAYLALVEQPTPETIAARNELAVEVLALQGRNQEALPMHQQALNEAQLIGDLEGQAMSLLGMTAVYRDTGHMEGARQSCEHAVNILRQAEDPWLEAMTLSHLAAIMWEQGHLDDALSTCLDALETHRQVGNGHWEGITLSRLAGIYLDQGQVAEALEAALEALESLRAVGDRRWEGITLGRLGAIYRWLGQDDNAVKALEDALVIHRDMGDRRYEAIAMSTLAALHRDAGRIELAREVFEADLEKHREVDDRLHQATTLREYAVLERLAAGDFEKARRYLDVATSIFRQVGNVMGVALCLCERGHLAIARGEDGRKYLQEIQGLDFKAHITTHSELGRALGRLGRAVRASELKAELMRGDAVEDVPDGLMAWLREAEHRAESTTEAGA